ncbi:MAG: type VI secretion system contractile sheath small subunit, partial [Cyanobacteria bacterium J06648_11]
DIEELVAVGAIDLDGAVAIDEFRFRTPYLSVRVSEGEGKLGVDLTFKKMEDFEPGKIAENVPALAKLLEARQQLNDLLIHMDGKQDATELLEKVLKDENLLKALSEAKAEEAGSDDAADAEAATEE